MMRQLRFFSLITFQLLIYHCGQAPAFTEITTVIGSIHIDEVTIDAVKNHRQPSSPNAVVDEPRPDSARQMASYFMWSGIAKSDVAGTSHWMSLSRPLFHVKNIGFNESSTHKVFVRGGGKIRSTSP